MRRRSTAIARILGQRPGRSSVWLAAAGAHLLFGLMLALATFPESRITLPRAFTVNARQIETRTPALGAVDRSPKPRAAVRGGSDSLRAFGGGRHAESAVLMGLVWLKNHQNPDGSWSCDRFSAVCRKGTCSGPGASSSGDTTVTGLALLAFLGDGHTHRHGQYKRTVKNALKALKDRQDADGCFAPRTPDGRWITGHAVVTTAMAEAYGLSNKSPLLRGPAQKAVDFLVDCQNPGLGWGRGRRPGANDTSATSWAVMALKAARMSGLHVPKEPFDGALRWFDRVTDERTHETASADSASVLPPTAQTVLSRVFILGTGAVNRPEILGGGNVLREHPPRWDRTAGTADLEYWFFGSHAMFQIGRRYWKAWNEPMKNALIPTQRRGGCEDGSWDPAGIGAAEGGRVFSTALAVLCLEVYYRYGCILPID